MGMDMTDQTARADDAADPPDAASTTSEPSTPPQADAAVLAVELKDRLLRTLAEMENLRKRTERELLKALEKNGVRQFTPHREKFDPNLHQAIFEVPDASVPAGSIVQVVQPGYMLGERVLRPALVGVSKGGAKVPASVVTNDNAKKSA